MNDRKYSVSSMGPRIEQFLTSSVWTRRASAWITRWPTAHATDDDFETPDVVVKFSGPDVDYLLANRAELLLALEHVTMEALRMPSEDHSRISFDANDYRLLRIEELRLSAAAAAEKVKRTGQPFRFNPMNSRERRVIHLALRNETEVRSEIERLGQVPAGGGLSGRDGQPARSAAAGLCPRRDGPAAVDSGIPGAIAAVRPGRPSATPRRRGGPRR